jgi:hypothetical protein
MAYIIIPILYFLIIYILSWFYISHGNIAVLEMKIWIYWSEWILEYFYIVLKIKTEKFTCPNKVGLGPEDWCSSWGSWAGGLSGAHREDLGPEDCLVLIVRVLGRRTVWCSLWGSWAWGLYGAHREDLGPEDCMVLTVRADIDFHISNEHVYVLNFGGSLQ